MILRISLLKLSTPFYICLIGLEIFLTYTKNHRDYPNGRPTLSGIAFMNALLNAVEWRYRSCLFRAAYVGILIWFYNFSVRTPISKIHACTGCCCFSLEDLAFYTLHYVDHHCRLFWAVHVTHHSSEHFNLTTGFRSSVFQPLYRFVYFIPLTLVGFNPADIIIMYSITQIYGIIVHTEYVGKLGWLEYIMVTPSHHRVHHASTFNISIKTWACASLSGTVFSAHFRKN
jgi:sterol desaturase/sphingolipid hydroxylase (fatty acid hydroxylase superfamily)